MGILSLLIANENGFPLYSKNLSDREIDDSLFVAFFSALRMFATSFLRGDGELKSMRIGSYQFHFNTTEFEELGRLDLLMISEGLDPSTAEMIISEIGEKFAIFLEEKNINLSETTRDGVHLQLKEFDPVLMQISNSCQNGETVALDIRWNIPKKDFNLVKAMFSIKKSFAAIYDNNETLFFEQLLTEFTNQSLENAIKLHFKYVSNDKSP